MVHEHPKIMMTFLVNCLDYNLYKQSCYTIDFVFYMVCHNLN